MKENIFDGYLLLSDLDGTLVTQNVSIPKRNLEAIERFKKLGGKFSVATGRNLVSVRRHHSLVDFNAPGIILNGGAIFDFKEDKFVSEVFLDKERAKSYIDKILDKFPEIGIEIYVDGSIDIIKNNQFVQYHVDTEQNNYNFCSIEDVKKQWYKVFFGVDHSIIDEVKEYAQMVCGDDVRFVASWTSYLEMLPVKSTKGIAFINMMEYLGIDKSKACAIGDYYNDLELLKEAGICAVPSNAPKDMQDMADVVVGDCSTGAVADFIEYLEKKIETERS